jgi:LysR family transcriptional regulator, hypochlorite-specific transcription factor HypT
MLKTINRPLGLEWLEDFEAVAHWRNFSKAAAARSMAQPVLSRHIKALEEWVGVPLLDRTSHPVSLTEAGIAFLPYSVVAIEQLIKGRDMARATLETAAKKLTLAATHVLSMTFFPQWLQELESKLHIESVQMTSDSFQACQTLMQERKVQCLLCHGHALGQSQLLAPDFVYAVMGMDALLPVAKPLAGGAEPDFATLPLLAYGTESSFGKIMAGVLPSVIQTDRLVTHFTSHHAVLLKTMALDGRGVAWLPKSLVVDELANKRLVTVGDAAWHIPIEIRLYRHADAMTQTAEAVWQSVCLATDA